jgi:hypothetical protein
MTGPAFRRERALLPLRSVDEPSPGLGWQNEGACRCEAQPSRRRSPWRSSTIWRSPTTPLPDIAAWFVAHRWLISGSFTGRWRSAAAVIPRDIFVNITNGPGRHSPVGSDRRASPSGIRRVLYLMERR